MRAVEAFSRGDTVLDVGESALAARIFACIATLDGRSMTITGRGTLLMRPMNMGPLRDFGIDVSGDLVPLTVRGPLRGGRVDVDGSSGSQLITGLLMALPLAAEDSILRIKNPVSISYIQMTLDVLAHFGIAIERTDHDFFIRGKQKYLPRDYAVEGDWSGASCMLVAGAFSRSGVTVNGLSLVSHQADIAILDALKAAGAEVAADKNQVTVRRGAYDLRAFEFDATQCPDLFPALVALAAACDGESVLTGASRLHDKESSRAEVLAQEYEKLGIRIDMQGNIMKVMGGIPQGSEVSSHGDHRIAMSLAISRLRATEKIIIDDTACVSKSYSEFWKDYEYFR